MPTPSSTVPVLFPAATLLALLTLAFAGESRAAEQPVKVFILAGQSNMEGKAQIKLLEYQIEQAETREQFLHLRNADGSWVERDDVWIKFLDRKGKLTVGFGSLGRIGPELAFGNAMGDHHDEKVLLIKTAWGGKSLFRDFRPPGAGLPGEDILAKLLENERKRRPETALEDIKASFGYYYRQMIKEVKDTLANLEKHFPDYRNQGYDIAGFIWFQGWNDMINAEYTAESAANMTHFIRDVRRDLGVADLPFVTNRQGFRRSACRLARRFLKNQSRNL